MAKYSVVFHPSETVIEAVKELKEQLSTKIGWFPSKNSLAHITICEFDYELATYENIKSRITAYCRYQNRFDVTFNSFENFTNGAFFIAPDIESKIKMAEIMKEIPKQIQFPVLVIKVQNRIFLLEDNLVKNSLKKPTICFKKFT